MNLEQPHYIAIQPYDREPQFYTLAEWRMKDILQNHYQTIEKHAERLMIETVYCLGLAPSEFIQIVRFEPKDTILFHEFMNDLTKINAPFMNFKDTVIGIGGIKDYPAAFGVENLEEEVHPDIRNKFEKRENVYVTKEDVTREDMKKEEEFLHKKGYPGPVWEYPLDKYGWKAFSKVIKPRKRRFAKAKRMVSILYLTHPGGWWTLPDHERAQVMMQHKVLLKKYVKQIDRDTAKLLGMSGPQFATIFEYPFENAPVYYQLLNDTMKIDSPYLDIQQVFTGIAGIGDYWLEQLKDVELKEVPMSKFSRSRWGIKA